MRVGSWNSDDNRMDAARPIQHATFEGVCGVLNLQADQVGIESRGILQRSARSNLHGRLADCVRRLTSCGNKVGAHRRGLEQAIAKRGYLRYRLMHRAITCGGRGALQHPAFIRRGGVATGIRTAQLTSRIAAGSDPATANQQQTHQPRHHPLPRHSEILPTFEIWAQRSIAMATEFPPPRQSAATPFFAS